MARRHQITTLLLLSAGCVAGAAGLPREPAPISALTDAEGYPLVGNVMAKGGPKPPPQPSSQPSPQPKPVTPRPHRAEGEPA
jgi:hypothetical protein